MLNWTTSRDRGCDIPAEARVAAAARRADENPKIFQRAYVTVEPGGVDPLSCETGSVAQIEIINSGNLPAYDVAWSVAFAFDSNHSRQKFAHPFPTGMVVLPPKGKMMQGGGCSPSLETWPHGTTRQKALQRVRRFCMCGGK